MRERFAAVIGRALLVLAIVAVGQGCSSSGGDKTDGGGGGSHGGAAGTTGYNVQQVCNQVCEKIGNCQADAGSADVVTVCKSATCAALAPPPGGETCTNESAMLSTAESCLSKACSQIVSCIFSIPSCEGSSSTGAGGAGGSGG